MIGTSIMNGISNVMTLASSGGYVDYTENLDKAAGAVWIGMGVLVVVIVACIGGMTYYMMKKQKK